MRRVAAAALAVMATACGTPSKPSPSATSSQPPAAASHGPLFPQCGGISDQTVEQLAQTTGLVNTGVNSVTCQWLSGGTRWPRVVFAWYRGSPIGRERKNEELTRARVEDYSIDGHGGFIAANTDSTGEYLCEIAIQFGDDFIEWSASFDRQPYPDPCGVVEELTRRSIANAK